MSAVFQPVQQFFRYEDLDLSYFEWGQPALGRPSLLFVHATGFHGRCWDGIIERFADCHCIAYEQHGHGRSEGGPIEHWGAVGAELAAFVDSLGYSFGVGIGHSMGAHSLVVAAALSPVFERLLLIDPTIFDPASYTEEANYRRAISGNVPSSRRRSEFDSPEQMIESLAGKGSFPVFDRRMFEDYCRHGLIEQEDGSFHLACSPQVESSVYVSSRSNNKIYDNVHAIDVPVHIMRARQGERDGQSIDFSTSPTWPPLVNEFAQASDQLYPDTTHFIPQQDPDEVERVLRRQLSRLV